MLNYVKEVAALLRTLEANLEGIKKFPQIVKDLSEKVESFDRKIDELDVQISALNSQIETKEEQLQRMNHDLHELKSSFMEHDKQLSKMFPNEEEKEPERRKFYPQKKYEGSIERDERIHHIIDNYVSSSSYDHFKYMLAPTVIDFLIEHIKKGTRSSKEDSKYHKYHSNPEKSYELKLSKLFDALKKAGYKVKGNEGFYLNVLRKIILKHNYEQLAEEKEFALMDRAQNLEEVVYYFLYLKETSRTSGEKVEHLAFLHFYLLEHGYGDFEQEIFYDGKLLKKVQRNYTQIELKIKHREKAMFEEELAGLRKDSNLTELIHKFIHTYDCFSLVLPDAVEYFTGEIHPVSIRAMRVNANLMSFEKELHNFLSVLENKGYKKPHRSIMVRVRELVFEKNYEEYAEKFQPLMVKYYSDISDVYYDYIDLAGRKKVHQRGNLAFLSMYLYKKGFSAELEDLSAVNEKVEKELERYDVNQLQKKLIDGENLKK